MLNGYSFIFMRVTGKYDFGKLFYLLRSFSLSKHQELRQIIGRNRLDALDATPTRFR